MTLDRPCMYEYMYVMYVCLKDILSEMRRMYLYKSLQKIPFQTVRRSPSVPLAN
jgi:hypothetical protein